MKKIKTLNKLLSSLILLSPLAGIGFNNQYENTQKVITENDSALNGYFNLVGDQRLMGEITVNVDGTAITGYVSGEGNLVVDSDITEIRGGAFSANKNITSLDLSKATSLTTIGENSLNASSLTGELFIPQNLSSIPTNTFDGNNFSSIYVSVLNRNFSLATNLGSDAKVLISGTDGIWKGDTKVILTLRSDIVIPPTISDIVANAFENKSIKKLDLSNAINLLSIGAKAFSNVNLQDYIYIPKRLQKIDSQAFSFNFNLRSVNLDKENKNFSLAKNLGNSRVLITGTDGIFDNYSFAVGSLAFGNITVPDTMTSLLDSSFVASPITSLDFSKAKYLETIGNYAFSECQNLSSNIVIPNSLIRINSYAFQNSNINGVDFKSAKNLTTINTNAFNCANISGELFIPEKLSTIGADAFTITKLTSVNVDQSNINFSKATNLGPNAQVLLTGTEAIFKDTSTSVFAAGEIIIPSNITTIASNAFSGKNITKLDLTIATSLTTIGSYAFSRCYDLKGNIVLSRKITQVGSFSFAFDNIDNLVFLSETPPTFESDWQPTVLGKVYVPSQPAKEAYIGKEHFGLTEQQIEIGIPKENNTSSREQIILGITLGLGIPIIIAGCIIVYLLATRDQKPKSKSKAKQKTKIKIRKI